MHVVQMVFEATRFLFHVLVLTELYVDLLTIVIKFAQRNRQFLHVLVA